MAVSKTPARKTAEKPAAKAPRTPRTAEKAVKCAPFYALNVRREPSEASDAVSSIDDGQKVAVEAEKDGWCRLADGSGYVKAEFLA